VPHCSAQIRRAGISGRQTSRVQSKRVQSKRVQTEGVQISPPKPSHPGPRQLRAFRPDCLHLPPTRRLPPPSSGTLHTATARKLRLSNSQSRRLRLCNRTSTCQSAHHHSPQSALWHHSDFPSRPAPYSTSHRLRRRFRATPRRHPKLRLKPRGHNPRLAASRPAPQGRTSPGQTLNQATLNQATLNKVWLNQARTSRHFLPST
jgi:hypothetical protein